MSAEEEHLDAVADEDDEEPEGRTVADWIAKRYQRLQLKNKAPIDSFLGEGQRVNVAGIAVRYYGELLTWALKRWVEKEGWKVTQTIGYHSHKPMYIDVSTDYDSHENLLMDGQLFVERGDSHLIVTVDINLRWRNSIQVEGPASKREEVEKFVDGVMAIAEEQNFYRGKRIEFAKRLRFLRLNVKSWDSIILDADTKKEIKANTIGFLGRRELWDRYRVPLKRGILIAGEPGTGKTIICKALMAEADGITCITTNAYGLSADEYITELYEMAEDLSPCIVFIEDIDLIGQNRLEFGYQRGPALLSLLAVLDGVEEKQEIVTVATTNNLETLDRAISQRPSRFDRVVKLSLPSLEERKELIGLLCQKIPVDKITQDYIAHKAEYCTPAQLQEIVFSLAIEYSDESLDALSPRLELNKEDIDRAVSRINGRNRQQIGFTVSGNHNGHRTAYAEALEEGKC